MVGSVNPQKRPQKREQRLSLYGMTPEDALRKALATPPPKPEKPPARSKAKVKQRKRKTG